MRLGQRRLFQRVEASGGVRRFASPRIAKASALLSEKPAVVIPQTPAWAATPLEQISVIVIRVDWIASPGTIQYYEVWARLEGGDFILAGLLNPATTTLDFDAEALLGAGDQTIVEVRVRATNLGIASPYTAVQSIETVV